MSASSWTKCQRLSHGPRTIAVCFCLLSRFFTDKPVNTKPRLSACFYCQGLHRNQKKRKKILFDLSKNHLSYQRIREAEGQSGERGSRGSSHVECTFPTGLMAAFLVPAVLDWMETWADVGNIKDNKARCWNTHVGLFIRAKTHGLTMLKYSSLHAQEPAIKY